MTKKLSPFFLTLFIFLVYQTNLSDFAYLSYRNSPIRQFSLDCGTLHLVSLDASDKKSSEYP